MAFILDVLVGGFAAGLVAIVAKTGVMMALRDDDEPMPAQLFVSKFVNDESPEENMELGLGLQALYGILAGIVLVGLADIGGFEESVLGLALFGLLFGVLLWFGALFWMGILGILSDLRDAPSDEVRKTVFGTLGADLLFGLVAGIVGALVAGAL